MFENDPITGIIIQTPSLQRDYDNAHPYYLDYASEMLIGDLEKQAMRGDRYSNIAFDPNVFEDHGVVSFRRNAYMLGNVFRMTVMQIVDPPTEANFDLRHRKNASLTTAHHHYRSALFLPGDVIKELPLAVEHDDNTNDSWFYYLGSDFVKQSNVQSDRVYGLTPHASILNLSDNATLWERQNGTYKSVFPHHIQQRSRDVLYAQAIAVLCQSPWEPARDAVARHRLKLA